MRVLWVILTGIALHLSALADEASTWRETLDAIDTAVTGADGAALAAAA